MILISNKKRIVRCWDHLIEAILSSVENEEKYLVNFGIKKGKISKIQHIMWLIVLAIISPKHRIDDDKLGFIFNKIHYPIIKKHYDIKLFCYAGKSNSSIDGMIRNPSFFSPFSRIERLHLLSKAFLFYMLHRRTLHPYAHYAMEAYIINHFIQNAKVKTIVSCGIFHRYGTLLSILARSLEMKYIFVQDGCYSRKYDAPVKVHCDISFVINEYEKEQISLYTLNTNCEYRIRGMTSAVQWSFLNDKHKQTIAFASQDLHTDMTIKALGILLREMDWDIYDLIIYPHYREPVSRYKALKKQYPTLRIEPDLRFRNIDYLITFYSTMAYDYLSITNDIKILCITLPDYYSGYYTDPHVYTFKDANGIIAFLEKENDV